MQKTGIKLSVFDSSVLEKIKKIPRGRITTYGILAKALNQPGAARAVGNALNKNPDAPRTPCHRVVKSDGQVGGYRGGEKEKIKLLEKEGIKIRQGKIIDFKKHLYMF